MQTEDIDEIDGQPLWRCRPGETALADCRALERLGVGHRCETWLAWSLSLWCPVVVKLVRPHQLTRPRARAALQREVDALADTFHPALPRLVAARLDHEVPHLVVEYVDGPTLADLVDSGERLTAGEVALLGAQLLPALDVLHRRGLAHLDVKPDNVALRDGRPVLLDFGSARRLGAEQPPGEPVGTLGYAAPEMEACAPVSPAMDLYGLGMVLAEALTGLPSPPPTPPPATPLAALIARLVDPDPDRRGPTGEVLAGLAAAAGARRPWPGWLEHDLARVDGSVASR